jgi:catechol 2,3-dioxygenase-like lactoylglutathione lyase family enzyme
MFDHIGLAVSSLAKSKAFYRDALAPLGIVITTEFEGGAGIGKPGKPAFWLGETKNAISPVHLAFAADNHAQVDEFYKKAIAAGAKDNGAPGLRPEYHAKYYAAFVIGPDGHNVEAVCHT